MGGANRSMLQLISELIDNHHITHPIIVSPPARSSKHFSLAELCKERGIKCYTTPISWFERGEKATLKLKAEYIIGSIIRDAVLLYKLRHEKFDLVHTNGSVIAAGALLAWTRGVPHVWHLREFGDLDFGLNPILGEKYKRWIYQHCHCAIAISKAVAERYKSYFGNKLTMIYNGVPLQHQHTREATGECAITNFCLVGRIVPSKNQLEALKACAILKRITNSPFHLLIVGTGQWAYTETLKTFIANNQLSECVTLTGNRNDVPQLLQKCDIGLTTSTCEAFGRVTVEYMMQNLAVIASSTGANPELVRDGHTGLLYELGNAEQLAEKMKLLLENTDLRSTIAHNGKMMARENFNSARNSESIFRLYQKLLSGKSGVS